MWGFIRMEAFSCLVPRRSLAPVRELPTIRVFTVTTAECRCGSKHPTRSDVSSESAGVRQGCSNAQPSMFFPEATVAATIARILLRPACSAIARVMQRRMRWMHVHTDATSSDVWPLDAGSMLRYPKHCESGAGSRPRLHRQIGRLLRMGAFVGSRERDRLDQLEVGPAVRIGSDGWSGSGVCVGQFDLSSRRSAPSSRSCCATSWPRVSGSVAAP